MNIFVLDTDPEVAAQMHCDKHCVKMVLELYQQLGSAVIRHGAKPQDMPLTSNGKPLKGGYHNHPCTLWVGTNRNNFLWAYVHALELSKEYTRRYRKRHSCENGILHLGEMFDILPDENMTPFAQAMPDDYKNDSAVLAYRNYYWYDKRKNIKCEWKYSEKPNWWKERENNGQYL